MYQGKAEVVFRFLKVIALKKKLVLQAEYRYANGRQDDRRLPTV